MQSILHGLLFKIISVFLSVLSLFGFKGDCIKADSTDWNTNYRCVFVHGLSGWGSYDERYKVMPYWGMFGGDLMEYLNTKGFECYAASVAPTGSAWDRACELYAQLTGTVVDYGKEHSERCNHARYGTDFTGKALIPSWSETDKINLFGHSFGGATVRLFASILEKGSEAEKAVTPANELSPFFEGGKGDYIYSLTALAAPHNGTTAYYVSKSDVPRDGENFIQKFVTDFENQLSDLIQNASNIEDDGRIAQDSAAFDMHIDNALALNETIATLENTYYFSIPCNNTDKTQDGFYKPDEKKMEILFVSSSKAMGAYAGVTESGFVIDESWRPNDGLVNVISARAPFYAPQTEYTEGSVQKGIWNIMPEYRGDHMSLQGGMTVPNDVKPLYVSLLSMINSL